MRLLLNTPLSRSYQWVPILSVIMAIIPTGEIGIGGVNMFPHILLLTLLTVVGLASRPGKFILFIPNFLFSKALLMLGACYLASFFLVLLHGNLLKASVYTAAYISSIFVFFLFCSGFRNASSEDLSRFYRAYVIFGVVLTVIVVATGNGDILRRSALQFNRNDYAMVVAQSLALLLPTLLVARGWRSLMFLVPTLFLLWGLFQSANRGALVGLLFGTTVLLIFTKGLGVSKKVVLFLTIGLALFSLVFFEHRLIQSIYYRGEYQDIARVAIAGVAVEMFRENFIFGVGVGNYWAAYLETVSVSDNLIYWLPSNISYAVYDVARPPHNLYLRVGIETGILGVIFLIVANCSALLFFLKLNLGASRAVAMSGLIYTVTYTFHAAFYEGYIYPFHYIFLGSLVIGAFLEAQETKQR